jgi:transposase
MPKKKDYHLKETELSQIREAIRKDKRPKVAQRATAIHMLHQGQKVADVAQTMAVSTITIYKWVERFREGGVDGLANQPKGRPKRKADDNYLKALAAALDQEPSELGYSFAIWTVERLRDHLEQETGVHLHVNYLSVLMRQQGFVYRRPKHDLTDLQDPDAREQAEELIDELKKRRSQTPRSNSSLWTRPS